MVALIQLRLESDLNLDPQAPVPQTKNDLFKNNGTKSALFLDMIKMFYII